MNVSLKNSTYSKFSRKSLSLGLIFAIVFSIFQPFSVLAAPAVPPITADLITSLNTITIPGSSSWVVPVGVNEIRVRVWGAGGSAGNGSTVSGHILGGGGGGGGGYAEKDIIVTPGESFTTVVGRGGVSSEEGVGRGGETSSFASSTTVLVSASGGKAGKRGTEIQAPAPTVSLSASSGQVFQGESTNVTWSSTNTDSCTATGILSGAKTISGSESLRPASSGSITMSCTGIGGTASASISITVDLCGPRGNCFSNNPSVSGGSSAVTTVATVNPLVAGASDFTGSAGTGLNGTTLLSGVSATDISFNSAGNIDSTDGGLGANGGAGGIHSTTGAGANGVSPAAGGGGSNVSVGGNGANGQIMIWSIVRGGPAVNAAPTGLTVTGPTTGLTSTSYNFSATATDPEGSNVRYGFDWNNDGTIDEYTSFVASGIASSTSHLWPTAGTYTFSVYAEDVLGAKSTPVAHTIVISDPCGPRGNCFPGPTNLAPTGLTVTGPITGTVNTSYGFVTTATDPENDNIRYGFDWNNDGNPDLFTAFGASGLSTTTLNSWPTAGTYTFGVFAEDVNGNRSGIISHTIVISNASSGGGGSSNVAPVIISVIGSSTPNANTAYSYTATATDANNDNVQFGFDWNNNGVIDGSESWTPLVASGVSSSQSNSWGVSGPHSFNVFARDSKGATSTPFVFNVNVVGGLSNVGFLLSTTTGLTTSESGSTAVFTVVLTAQPTANVTLPVISSDFTEGTTSVTSLTFTPANWNVYQTVTVTGVDDTDIDGNKAYTVNIGPSTSSDVNFNALAGQTVSLINYDNDGVAPTPAHVSSRSGGGSSGGGNGPCFGFGCPTAQVAVSNTISAPVTPVVPTGTFCPASDFIVSYMRKGSQNDPNEVKKLQYFLNMYEKSNLEVNGIFDDATEIAVKNLQSNHADEILAPWNINIPTGIVYITTSSYINRSFCHENPLYKAGDLDKTIKIVPTEKPPVDNSADFKGAIGIATTSASSTNLASVINKSIFTNIAGVFGAFSANVIDFLKTIPWYPIIITLMVIIGTGIIIRGIYAEKKVLAPVSRMSFIQGYTVFGAGTVLNVLNTMSFMKDPTWFHISTGLDVMWILALGLINLIAVVVICVTFITFAHIDYLKASK